VGAEEYERAPAPHAPSAAVQAACSSSQTLEAIRLLALKLHAICRSKWLLLQHEVLGHAIKVCACVGVWVCGCGCGCVHGC
jgi:hypothetical protein